MTKDTETSGIVTIIVENEIEYEKYGLDVTFNNLMTITAVQKIYVHIGSTLIKFKAVQLYYKTISTDHLYQIRYFNSNSKFYTIEIRDCNTILI